jgi:hypothetical protein
LFLQKSVMPFSSPPLHVLSIWSSLTWLS